MKNERKIDEVSPRLDRIIGYSKWLKDDAESIAYNVRTMPMQRDFETRAQAAMLDAKAQLQNALEIVNDALKQYADKPTKTSVTA